MYARKFFNDFCEKIQKWVFFEVSLKVNDNLKALNTEEGGIR